VIVRVGATPRAEALALACVLWRLDRLPQSHQRHAALHALATLYDRVGLDQRAEALLELLAEVEAIEDETRVLSRLSGLDALVPLVRV
jgi:lipopolysaccharide biosynthesis regulator YciM